MYNNTNTIRDNYEKDHFDPYIARIAAQLAQNDPSAEGKLESFTESYKEQLTSLLGKTPSVYYETLRNCFGLEMQANLDNYVNMENLPFDLSAELKERTPESFYHFLQYIGEADVEVLHTDAADYFYERTLSELELQKQIKELGDEEPEEISPQQYAENLGIPKSMLSKKIGEKAANCAVFSNAALSLVKTRLGLEDLDLSEGLDPEAKEMYDDTMKEIASLPSVCYGMLHAATTGRNVPDCYDTRGKDYLDDDIITYGENGRTADEIIADRLSSVLCAARTGDFGIKDPDAAKQYFERYSSLEPVTRTTPATERNSSKRLKEQLEDFDKQCKLEDAEKAEAKKEGMAKFNAFTSKLKNLGNLTKAEHDFLSAQAKIYAKENALLDKANSKYDKALRALEKLKITGDVRDLTAKEQKAMEKATAELERAEAQLESLKNDLIERNRTRSEGFDPRFKEHAELREEQIRSGDTTYVPLHTREDSINQGMYGYKARVYARERQELLNPAPVVTTNTPQVEAETTPTPREAQVNRTPIIADLGVESVTKQTRVELRDTVERESPSLSSEKPRTLND